MSSSKMMTTTTTLSFPQEALVPFLPQEILVQILSKLPAKSLVRFKCVSKFFYSLVFNHSFADLHRNWSLTQLPSRMSILISLPIDMDYVKHHWRYTINYSEENQGKLHVNRLQYIDNNRKLFGKVYISSSVNGLICFCTYSRRDDGIAIHNLSTRKHISLPSCCPSVQRNSGSRFTAFGLLGFDSVSRRYKVLKSVQYTDSGYRHVSVKHWVFTLGVDKLWREIDFSPSYHPYTCFNNHFYFRTSVHIDGIIYSLNSLNKGQIVAFDVRTENFQAIPPPPPPTMPGLVEGVKGVDSGRSGLVEVDGRLAIVDLISDNLRYGMAIWILEESMVWKNQYLIFIPIPLEEIQCYNKRVLFVATNDAGEIAVLVSLKKFVSVLLFYNIRKQSWRRFDICGLPPLGCQYPVMYFTLDSVF